MSKKKAMFFKQEVATEVDVFPQNNAAALSDDASATGWTTTSSAVDFTNVDPYDGLNCIIGTASSNFGLLKANYEVVIGKTYTISMWVKKGIGDTGSIEFRAPVAATVNEGSQFTSKTWINKTGSAVATASGACQIFVNSSFGGASGDTVYVDRIEIIETD